MRFSLPSFILLTLALTFKAFACVQFQGVVAVGNGQQFIQASLVDNGGEQCWTSSFVSATASFIFLTCNPGYLGTFQWDILGTSDLEVWYNTPWESGGSFGLNYVGSADGTVYDNGVEYEAFFATYTADVWGC